jgi:membrane protein
VNGDRRRRLQRAAPVESPWKLGGLRARDLADRVYRQAYDNELFDRAAALSYYFLFALFPTLLFLTALLGLAPIPHLMDQLMGYVGGVLPHDAASLVIRTLAEVVQGARRSLLSIGVLAALWAASSGMGSIIAALNAAYDVKDSRPWWKQRLLAIGLTIGFSLFTVTALLLLVFGERIGDAVARTIGLGTAFTRTWNIAQWPALVLCVLAGITLVYYLAPAVNQRWHWVTPGAAFALVAWLLMSGGLRLYVGYFGNYNATYGSIGGVIILMIWLYLSGVVLLLGAEINSEIHLAALDREARVDMRVASAPSARERAL